MLASDVRSVIAINDDNARAYKWLEHILLLERRVRVCMIIGSPGINADAFIKERH